MSEKDENLKNYCQLRFEMMNYGGIPFRKKKATKPFKSFLKKRGLQSIVDWIEKKELNKGSE